MIRVHNATSVQVEATPAPGQVTQFLSAAGAGDKPKFDALFALVYPMLKKHAQRLERPGVGKTELVHGAYAKLLNGWNANPANRDDFYAIAYQTMRNLRTDYRRATTAKKRGGKTVDVDPALAANAVFWPTARYNTEGMTTVKLSLALTTEPTTAAVFTLDSACDSIGDSRAAEAAAMRASFFMTGP